jgi:hypothetical protein
VGSGGRVQRDGDDLQRASRTVEAGVLAASRE